MNAVVGGGQKRNASTPKAAIASKPSVTDNSARTNRQSRPRRGRAIDISAVYLGLSRRRADLISTSCVGTSL